MLTKQHPVGIGDRDATKYSRVSSRGTATIVAGYNAIATGRLFVYERLALAMNVEGT